MKEKYSFFNFLLFPSSPCAQTNEIGITICRGKKQGVSPPPKDPKYFAQLLPDTPKIFFGETCVYLLIGRKKFLAELPSGQIYKRLKKMLPK
jgi:hypothetical protein